GRGKRRRRRAEREEAVISVGPCGVRVGTGATGTGKGTTFRAFSAGFRSSAVLSGAFSTSAGRSPRAAGARGRASGSDRSMGLPGGDLVEEFHQSGMDDHLGIQVGEHGIHSMSRRNTDEPVLIEAVRI